MEARLSAVQKALWWLLGTSLVLLLVGRPEPRNRSVMDALAELTAFQDGFDRNAVEQSLREHAQAQGALPLTAILPRLRELQGPALSVAAGAAPIRPLSAARLDNLEAVRAHASAQAQLSIASPDPAAIGAALSWRLAQSGKAGPFTLRSVELVQAPTSRSAADHEQATALLRLQLLGEQEGVAQAQKKHEIAENIFEARRKRQLPWKDLVDSYEARNAAKLVVEQTKQSLATVQGAYERSTKRAEQDSSDAKTAPDLALAKVTVEEGGKASTITIPLVLTLRQVAVPPLKGSSFSATRSTGLWDEVKTMSAADARIAVEKHFNWHYRYLTVGGLKVGGMTVLQLAPCLLIGLLALLLMRIRSATATYSPFSTTPDELRRVGLKSRILELLVIVLLPFAAAASAAMALLMIDHVPVLPVLTAAVCVALGGYTFMQLGELKGLVDSVVRHSSYPPPNARGERRRT